MTHVDRRPDLRRRWNRFVLRSQGRLDGETADTALPWLSAVVVFSLLLSLNTAAIRTLSGGSGLGPWVQASWRRRNGGIGIPVGGVDPAHGPGSLISEPILWLTRFVPAEAVFAIVQAGAIALTVVPLWHLARSQARLRVGAAMSVIVAFALAPTLHRANLTAFHPELIAMPALVWAYERACQKSWITYGALIAVVLACRADLGFTVLALGLLLAITTDRRPGLTTMAVGFFWSMAGIWLIDPATPNQALTPAGEFVARATTPLAVLPNLMLHPVSEARELLAEPSVLFLVVVLSPLLFLPLMAPRKLLAAVPCLLLAMIADRSVQRVAQVQVLDLAPAAAHIGPAVGFVFVALIFSLERIGVPSVSRINVDRRVLLALLIGASLLFVTEAPASPYRQPWDWGSRQAVEGAALEAADLVVEADAVAVSPSFTAAVARRAIVVEVPLDPLDFTEEQVRSISRRVDKILLDTSKGVGRDGLPIWSAVRRDTVLARFGDQGFTVVYAAEGVYLLERA